MQTRSLNTDNIFIKFDTDHGGSLSLNEFYMFLMDIDSRITFSEAQHLFAHVDTSKDGSVSIKEFKSIFNEWDFSDINDTGA